MPIAIQARPQNPHPSTRELTRNFRDSKGYGMRVGVRSEGIRSLGKRFNANPGIGQTLSFAPDPRLAEPRMFSMQMSSFARLPQEPEDARMTGVTRSLPRRLLALNISGTLRAVRPVTRSEPMHLQEKIA